MRRALPALVIVLAFVSLVAVAASRDGDDSRHEHPADVTVTTTDPDPDLGPDPSVQLARAEAVVAYSQALDAQQVGDYITGLQRAEVDAFLATLYTPPPPAVESVLPPAPAVGASHGGHSDAWWMGVAQCEQGGRNDPYFGYFSFMDGSQGGRSWADQVAAGNALLASVGSESPAWAPACVAAGYAASPSG